MARPTPQQQREAAPAPKVTFKKAYGKVHNTPAGRLIFPHIAYPVQYDNAGAFKHNGNLIVLPGEKLNELLADIEAVGRKGFSDWMQAPPGKYRRPIISGEEVMARSDKAPESLYSGKFVITASGSAEKGAPKCYLADKSVMMMRPGVDEDLKMIEKTFYAGCYARFAVTPAAYQKGKSEGVTLIFKGCQFYKDGVPLGQADLGEVFAADFGEVPEDEVDSSFGESVDDTGTADVNL